MMPPSPEHHEVALAAAPNEWMPCNLCDAEMPDKVIGDSDPKFRFLVKAEDKTWTFVEGDEATRSQVAIDRHSALRVFTHARLRPQFA